MPTKEKLVIGREYPAPDEDEQVASMIRGIVGQMDDMYGPGDTLRQAHPHEHGFLAAEFIVEPNLPDHLKVGIFAEQKSYPTWIRSSSASIKVKPDIKKDTRGFAMKIVGVPGEKLYPDRNNANCQDFLLVSSPVFLAKSIKEFSGLLNAVTSGKVIPYALNPLHWPTLIRASKELIKTSNLLQIPYWSAVPYQFGELDQAVKYHIAPRSPKLDPMPDDPTDWFLRERMVEMLDKADVWYDFFIQFQEDAEKMPIEDPTVKWTSPYIKVASIRIPKQNFTAEKRFRYGEHLQFNPWHSLPAHRPLGCFNRARRQVYPVASANRLKRNQVPPEPVIPPKIPKQESNTPSQTNTTMTNKQIVQTILQAYEKQDLPTVMSYMADDVVWFTQGDKSAIPYCGTYNGKAAVEGYFMLEAKLIKATTFTPTGLTGGDDEATQVFTAHEVVEVLATGKSYTTEFAMIIQLNNGLVSHVTSLMDTLAVAKAFEV